MQSDQWLDSPQIPCRSEHAPGGVPTMVVNDHAGNLTPHGALWFFASRLAPTGDLCRLGQPR
ncbi:hypothetical protein PSUM_09180 [Pseudomonas umsongensis]|uniref:Uncharacterized protein n=1 Tax=Pseudomonas umsongensis TaxID=198618 RepID=A0ABX4E2X4_9PSED|nr:hypothetical protein PSUM_09180 [Pseudomonas umsongensis]